MEASWEDLVGKFIHIFSHNSTIIENFHWQYAIIEIGTWSHYFRCAEVLRILCSYIVIVYWCLSAEVFKLHMEELRLKQEEISTKDT